MSRYLGGAPGSYSIQPRQVGISLRSTSSIQHRASSIEHPASSQLPSGVFPHQPPLGEDVPVHSSFDLAFGRTWGKVQHRVEGINLEEIPVRAARRSRAAVADSAEIGRAMHSSVGQGLLGQYIFFEACYIGADVIDNPMQCSWSLPARPSRQAAERYSGRRR